MSENNGTKHLKVSVIYNVDGKEMGVGRDFDNGKPTVEFFVEQVHFLVESVKRSLLREGVIS